MNTVAALSLVVTPEQIVNELVKAKHAEAQANRARVALEEQLINLLGKRQEGSQTHDLANGLKVTITGKLSYKADMEKLQAICAKLPLEMRPIKTEIKLDETGAKFLRANEPAIWAQLSLAITIKDAKPSVEVKA